MMSSNGNIFHFTGPLCMEFTGHRWIPLSKASNAELWCFLWSSPWANGWVNNREAGDLRRHCTHYDVILMPSFFPGTPPRLLKSTVDFDKITLMPPDNPPTPFSFLNESVWIEVSMMINTHGSPFHIAVPLCWEPTNLAISGSSNGQLWWAWRCYNLEMF